MGTIYILSILRKQSAILEMIKSKNILDFLTLIWPCVLRNWVPYVYHMSHWPQRGSWAFFVMKYMCPSSSWTCWAEAPLGLGCSNHWVGLVCIKVYHLSWVANEIDLELNSCSCFLYRMPDLKGFFPIDDNHLSSGVCIIYWRIFFFMFLMNVHVFGLGYSPPSCWPTQRDTCCMHSSMQSQASPYLCIHYQLKI